MDDFFKELQEENGLTSRKKSGANEIERMFLKLDGFLARNDYAEAEKLLRYYLSEAETDGSFQMRIAVLNELMGLYRKLGRREDAYSAVEKSTAAITAGKLSDTVTDATVSLNAATVYKCFGEDEKALELYEQARIIYERELIPTDERLAGLYNNEALALTSLGRFKQARHFFNNALEIITKKENGAPEAAITYLNLADMTVAESGEGGALQADEYVQLAQRLLDPDKNLRDGNYAFVCEKCAPVFERYGYFDFAEQIKKESERIYEGS